MDGTPGQLRSQNDLAPCPASSPLTCSTCSTCSTCRSCSISGSCSVSSSGPPDTFLMRKLILLERPCVLDFHKLTKCLISGRYNSGQLLIFTHLVFFGGKSLQFAICSLTCERQWTMAQTRHKDLGEVQFSSEKCKLIVEDLLPTKVHYVLFWTSRLVFPERREL